MPLMIQARRSWVPGYAFLLIEVIVTDANSTGGTTKGLGHSMSMNLRLMSDDNQELNLVDCFGYEAICIGTRRQKMFNIPG
jgi:hypothetical protein